ncbi:helix-turn-helix domain-containing protein [Streptomyces osmaniensis]|nr:transposase family protein [Streptomyces sp. JCM17656]
MTIVFLYSDAMSMGAPGTGHDGDRPCGAGRQGRLRPYNRARCTLVYLRKRDTLEQLAAGFGMSTMTPWRYVNHTIGQLAAPARR